MPAYRAITGAGVVDLRLEVGFRSGDPVPDVESSTLVSASVASFDEPPRMAELKN